MKYLTKKEKQDLLSYEPTDKEIEGVRDKLKESSKKIVVQKCVEEHKNKVKSSFQECWENNEDIHYSDIFWELDFSVCNERFKEKNITFFEKLDSWEFSIDLVLNNGRLDFYSLIKINANDEEFELESFYWKERIVWDNIIPVPVFFNIIKNNNWPDVSWEDEYFIKYFKNKFWLEVENIVERENEEYDDEVPIEELQIRQYYWEYLSDEEVNRIIYSLKWSNDSVFEYGIPKENIINYIFDDTYHNSWILKKENAEENLWEELKEFFKKSEVSKLKEFNHYWNLPKWVIEYALKELKIRYLKWKNEYLKNNSSSTIEKEFSESDISNITEEEMELNPHFIQETVENKKRLLEEEEIFNEILWSFKSKFWDDMVIVEYNRAWWAIMKNHRGHNVYKDDFAMKEMLSWKQPYDTCYVVKWKNGSYYNESRIEESNKLYWISDYS